MTAPVLTDEPTPVRTPYRISASTQFVVLARAMLKAFFRDKAALFFTFLFPLMFLVVFGLIFGNSSTGRTTIGVVGEGSVVSHLPGSVFTVKHYDSLAAGQAAVQAGKVPAVVTQQGSTVQLRYAASDQVKAATIQGIMSSVVDRANVQASGRPAQITLSSQRVEDQSLKSIQFLTPGILSWGVATSAAFGAALTLVSWRKTQLLRRVRLSPAPVWTVVAARIGVSLIVAFVQAIVFVAVGMTPVFGLQLTGQWYWAIPLLAAGTLSFMSIGLLVGSIAKTEEAASAIANFVVLPMAFLSGTFFDISQAPAWLRAISEVLPLRHLNDAMLDVLVRGQGVGAIGIPIAVLVGFAVVLTFIATRVFSWDDA